MSYLQEQNTEIDKFLLFPSTRKNYEVLCNTASGDPQLNKNRRKKKVGTKKKLTSYSMNGAYNFVVCCGFTNCECFGILEKKNLLNAEHKARMFACMFYYNSLIIPILSFTSVIHSEVVFILKMF